MVLTQSVASKLSGNTWMKTGKKKTNENIEITEGLKCGDFFFKQLVDKLQQHVCISETTAFAL